MWIDTHCHLDAAEFDADRDAVVERARSAGVCQMVLPAVDRAGFERVRDLAHRHGFAYALGIHPLAVERAQPSDLDALRRAARAALEDPRFVAIGEIGLDAFEGAPPLDLQERYYAEQLRIAQELSLPVILHVRRTADKLIHHLRRTRIAGGIAHAFNGSAVQAQGFLDLGVRLGFGGASTYDGSLRIRRFAAELGPGAIVLETDSPDIPPQWLREGGRVGRNEPAQLARIARAIADLRAMTLEALAQMARDNSCAALPRLAALEAARR
jgi:TatD DNase family protein